ncbi:MAG: hypothetical protein SFU83_20610 [Meiothermus sp.]|nr:hypothetical protein [Meiothermus sp.]
MQYSIDLSAAELRLGLGFPLLVGGGLLNGSVEVLFPMGSLNASTR